MISPSRPPVAKVTEVLSPEEIRDLTRASDLRGFVAVGSSWGIIAFAFGLVAWWPHFSTILLALVLLGGRHLGLAILMHEAAHRSLFRTRVLNDFVGEWLCAAPTWQHLGPYRKHHLAHHAHTGGRGDPDLGLVAGFPISRRSLARKLLRDLLGLTGLRRVAALALMEAGVLGYTASTDPPRLDQSERTAFDRMSSFVRGFAPVAFTNAGLLCILWASGHPWLYSLWVLAYLTTFSVFVRIRSMAEHAGVGDPNHAFLNTRTVRAGPLARLTVAPHRVNFHLEHHLLMTVPHHRLPQMHRLLCERGALVSSPIAGGYVDVLRQVTR